MTIDEAIRILRLNEGDLAYETQKGKARAKKLGIEALEFIKDLKGGNIIEAYQDLPGETEE